MGSETRAESLSSGTCVLMVIFGDIRDAPTVCGLKEGSKNVWILPQRLARDKGSRFYKAVDEDSASVPIY